MNEIYIVPQNGRWYLFKSDKSIAGSKTGYKSKQAAERAKWYLEQGRDTIKATYAQKRQMSQEMRHLNQIRYEQR